jgi:hypothetical protein
MFHQVPSPTSLIERDVGDDDNNLMKLGGSLGNIPQKLKKKLVIKTRYISDC